MVSELAATGIQPEPLGETLLIETTQPTTAIVPAQPRNLSPIATDDNIFDMRKIGSLRFAVQTGLSIGVLMFCIGQIVAHDITGRRDDVALYWGGITGILAWWMPSPTPAKSPEQ